MRHWDLQDDTNMAIETFSKLTELPETRWEAYIYLAWALANVCKSLQVLPVLRTFGPMLYGA